MLTDAVDALDLVDLPRSTLSESVSAFAVLTVEEVVADLGDLNWQECCVTSIQKFGCCEDQKPFPVSSDQNLQAVNHSQSQSHKHGGLIPEAFKRRLQATKMVPRRKRSSIHALYSATSIVDSASLASCWINDSPFFSLSVIIGLWWYNRRVHIMLHISVLYMFGSYRIRIYLS